MKLVLVTHRSRTTFQIGNVSIVIGHNQCTFKLPCTLRIDAEVGGQLHGATHTFGDVNKRSVGENSGVKRSKEIVAVRNNRAQVLLHQIGMLADGFTHRAKDDAFLHQCFLESSLYRDGVHHGIHGHAAQCHLLLQGNAQFIEGFDQFRIHFVHTLGTFLLLSRVGIVRDGLIVNLGNAEVSPCGHLQCQPVAVSLQAELQHPVGLTLLLGDKTDNVFVQALLDDIGMHVGGEAIFVLLLREFLDIFIGFFLHHNIKSMNYL